MRSLGQFLTYFFFYDKISQVQKSTKKHQKALPVNLPSNLPVISANTSG